MPADMLDALRARARASNAEPVLEPATEAEEAEQLTAGLAASENSCPRSEGEGSVTTAVGQNVVRAAARELQAERARRGARPRAPRPGPSGPLPPAEGSTGERHYIIPPRYAQNNGEPLIAAGQSVALANWGGSWVGRVTAPTS